MNNKTKIGLGTFPFSGVFSEISSEMAEKIVERFFDLGGTYVETAPVYAKNNISIGEILKEYPRESFYLATKCVTGQDEFGNKFRSGKQDILLQQCDTELKRLNMNYFDLLQSHAVAEDVPIEETARTLQLIKDKGIALEIGVSNVTLEQLKNYTEFCEVRFVQNRFSLIHQSANREIEKYCIEKDIKLNPYQLIERGLLTPHPTNNGDWRENDLRNTKHEYKGDAYFTIRNWVNSHLMPIASRYNMSLESLVLSWSCRQPQVELCVVGATNVSQVDNIIASGNYNANSDLLLEINATYDILSEEIKDRFNLTIEEFRGLK
jgi:aryl-alcohol dehydrogenase-like predicted oxidoreductase